VCTDCSYDTTTSMGNYRLRRKVTIAQRVEHRRMSAEESAPTHSDSCKHSNGITVHPSVGNEVRHETEGSAHRTKSSDRECHKMWVLEAEQPLNR
jgi:hypothetical protein